MAQGLESMAQCHSVNYICDNAILLLRFLHDRCCAFLGCRWTSKRPDHLNIYLFIFYFVDAVSEWHKLFYLLISSACIAVSSSPAPVTVIVIVLFLYLQFFPQVCTHQYSPKDLTSACLLEVDLNIRVLCSTCIIIHLNPAFYL